MYACKVCNKICFSRDQLGGHISGHVRSGDINKRVITQQCFVWKCDICGYEASNARQRSGHFRKHSLLFEDIKGSGTRKNRLIEERGYRCEICKNETWLNSKIPIEIDHIDGDSDNNIKENLRLLCPNCHAMQSTKSGKNVGKFPTTKRNLGRRKYYLKASDRCLLDALR